LSRLLPQSTLGLLHHPGQNLQLNRLSDFRLLGILLARRGEQVPGAQRPDAQDGRD
jgi:hypothetical protein